MKSYIPLFVALIGLIIGIMALQTPKKPDPILIDPTPIVTIEATSSPIVNTTTAQTVATTTPMAKPVPDKPVVTKPTTTPPVIVAQPTVPTTTPTVPAPDPTALNLRTREAVVNVLCVAKTSGSFDPISGSGVMIDSRGIILTNAHVGQYFLLKNFQVPNFMDCTIRTGSPASPKYRASLIYISPRWIAENAPKINLERSLGTGENDFALLRITETVSGQPLPSSFTAVPPDTNFNGAKPDHPVLLVSYPAAQLGGILTQTSLNQLSSLANIKEGYFFTGGDSSRLDVFSLGGNLAAEGGSSGGAVVNRENGNLVGILVTSTSAASTDDKNLQALSLSHINRSLTEETNKTLASFLAEDPAVSQTSFMQNSFQKLRLILENAILGN